MEGVRDTVFAHVASSAAVLAGCSRPAATRLGFGTSDVEALELFVNPWRESGQVRRTSTDERASIDPWVRLLDGQPVDSSLTTSSLPAGTLALGLRFRLRTGSVAEAHVFAHPNEPGVVGILPDGSRFSAKGSPEFPTGGEVVAASAAPKVPS